MRPRSSRPYRRWPIWLLFAALLLLVLTVLLMHRSYRGQIDASMARVQQSVATARALQARLAERLQTAGPRLNERSGTDSAPAEAVEHGQRGVETSTTAARRLRAVAAELDRMAALPSADVPGPAMRRYPSPYRTAASELDWPQIRIALRDLQHAIRRDWLIGSRHGEPVSTHQRHALREWLARSRTAASREDAAVLAQALMAIERILDGRSARGVWHAGSSGTRAHHASDLARRSAALRTAISPPNLPPQPLASQPASASRYAAPQRQALERLAQETAAIARAIDPTPRRRPEARPEARVEPGPEQAGPSASGSRTVTRRTPEPRPAR
jgi:hypothetical protein